MKHSLSGKSTFELLGSRIEMLPNIRLWGAQLLRGKNSDVWTLKFSLSVPKRGHFSNCIFLFWVISIVAYFKIAKSSWIIAAKTLLNKGLYRCNFLSSRFFSSKFFRFWCPKIWNVEKYWLLELLKLILWHKRTSSTLKSTKLILESKISNFEAPKMEEFGREKQTT